MLIRDIHLAEILYVSLKDNPHIKKNIIEILLEKEN